MGFFATRRELKRLAASEHYHRGKAETLEKEKARLFDLLLERDMLWADRILTASGKFPIADEAEHKVFLKDVEAVQQVEKDELKTYLRRKHDELVEEAKEAKAPLAKAEELYKKREAVYIEDFQSANGFK